MLLVARMNCDRATTVVETGKYMETTDYFVWVPEQSVQQVERDGQILPTGEYDYVKLKRSLEDSLRRENQFGAQNTTDVKAGLVYKIAITEWGQMIWKQKGNWFAPRHLNGSARFFGALPLDAKTDTGIPLTCSTEVISIS